MSGIKRFRVRGWHSLAALLLFTAIGLTASGALAGKLADTYNAVRPPADQVSTSSRAGESASSPRSTSLVVSQVYGGGGNSGAPWHNDFVEIFNPTGASVSFNGWSVQYASST